MSERLITMTEAAKRLGICRQHYYELLPELKANGLQIVKIRKNSYQRVRETSLDKLIKNAAEKEMPLISVGGESKGL